MDYSKIEIRLQQETSKNYCDFFCSTVEQSIKRYKSEFGVDADYPAGCLEYIRQMGEGALGGCIYIYPPFRTYKASQNYQRYYQQMLHEAPVKFFDSKGRKLRSRIPNSDFNKILLIGKAPDGEIFYYKENFYVRWDGFIYLIGTDLNSVLQWYESGLIIEASDLSFFVPEDSCS